MSAEIYRRLANEFDFFARNCLKIAPKNVEEGGLIPFHMNYAQRHLHDKIEDQIKRQGMARMIILKARQQGISTYIGGRFLHKTLTNKARRAFIMAHDTEATNNLYNMVRRYYDFLPNDPCIKQPTRANSAREFDFAATASGYRIATAGSEGAGVSQTIHYLHASEFALWQNPESHLLGSFQAVPQGGGSEIIIESTAYGVGNKYHEMWEQAERGHGNYEAVFIPWFWSPEYQMTPPMGWHYEGDNHYNLSQAQLYWREQKILEMGHEWIFKQAYPASSVEAFQTGTGGFIDPAIVLAATKPKFGVDVSRQPVIIGIDPATDVGNDPDKTAMVVRQGAKILDIKTFHKYTVDMLLGEVLALSRKHNPRRLFVDANGFGYALYNAINTHAVFKNGNIVTPIYSGRNALDHARYVNLRTEMWDKMRMWLEEPNTCIPEHTTLMSDLTMLEGGYDGKGKKRLQSKKDLNISPDVGDALAFTFAYPVPIDIVDNNSYYSYGNSGSLAPMSPMGW